MLCTELLEFGSSAPPVVVVTLENDLPAGNLIDPGKILFCFIQAQSPAQVTQQYNGIFLGDNGNEVTEVPIPEDLVEMAQEAYSNAVEAVADDDEGKADAEPEAETPEGVKPAVKQVRIVCGSGSVNIRVGNDTRYGRITSVKNGATYEWIATAENGWHAIVVNAQIGWVSGKYSRII